MDRLSFYGGSYSARSVIAEAQRSINYFPELNPKNSPEPFTLYQRPGLRLLNSGPQVAPVRCLYQASNGVGYAVIGKGVYRVNTDFSTTHLGDLTVNTNVLCSMIDNGTTIVLVDSSNQGWEIDLASDSFSLISDSTGTFNGARRVDILDTFILWNMPGTNKYGSTLSGEVQFDGLYFAAKAAYPDELKTLIVNRREILLMGRFKSEIWYDAGNTNFPFAELPGAYIEHGIVAPYSIAASDISSFWLGNDLQGQGIVFRQRGYDTTRISNHALEYAIRNMPRIDDAQAYMHQQDGHVFYVLTFPTADQTWVYDDAVQDPNAAWHQRAWTDLDGALHRERGNCFAFLYGVPVVGDWENGALYALDPNAYWDELPDQQYPLTCIRGFPHVLFGKTAGGFTIPSNGLIVSHDEFVLNLEAGNNPVQDIGPNLLLRYSDDRGRTWTDANMVSSGKLGEYKTRPNWRGLGLAMDRVYEVQHSVRGQVALNGAWVFGRITEAHKASTFSG